MVQRVQGKDPVRLAVSMRQAKKRACRVGLLPPSLANRWMGTPGEPTAVLPLKYIFITSNQVGQQVKAIERERAYQAWGYPQKPDLSFRGRGVPMELWVTLAGKSCALPTKKPRRSSTLCLLTDRYPIQCLRGVGGCSQEALGVEKSTSYYRGAKFPQFKHTCTPRAQKKQIRHGRTEAD